MDSMPPRKMQSILSHPIRWPTLAPTSSMAAMTVMAMVKALPPTVAIFRKLNSSPRANIRKITPISPQTSISVCSTMVGRYSKWGLIKKPATI